VTGIATSFTGTSSGDVATVEFRCVNCGYGISLTGELPRCPMCRRRSWQRLPQRRALNHSPQP
jgi:lipopolysaccharide biosynthesis regulator YciM